MSDSEELLKKVIQLIGEKGYKVGNIDAALCLEKPKIGKRVPEMQEVIARICNVTADDISIKATTNEKMGFVGREEGVCAYATALIIGV